MADMNICPHFVEDTLEAAKKELETWKVKVEKADDVKSRLLMEKLDEERLKAKAKQEMHDLVKKQDDCKEEFTQNINMLQHEISQLGRNKQALLDKLSRCQKELEAKKVESAKLKQTFKISAQILDTEVKFTAQDEKNDDDSQSVRGVFVISQTPSVVLKGGQALITFEEEEVASQIMRFAKCSVSCEHTTVDVTPKRIIIDPVVKFEGVTPPLALRQLELDASDPRDPHVEDKVHLDIDRKKLQVSSIPVSLSMPQERVKDRLEMSFSRPSRGGGEVERVTYDKKTNTGIITFLHPGVAERLALRGSYQVNLDSEVKVQVLPVYEHHLHKFQTFCGVPKRTILLDGIRDVMDEEELEEHLEIHFQKPCNSGGETEHVQYVSAGNVRQAFFFEDNRERDN